MGFALLWVEGLAAILFLVAWVTAWSTRFRWRWTQAAFPGLIAFVVGAQAAAWSGIAFFLERKGALQFGMYVYIISWIATTALSILAVLYFGLKSVSPVPSISTPLQKRWFDILVAVPIVRLAFIAVCILAALFLTASVADAIKSPIDYLKPPQLEEYRIYHFAIIWAVAYGICLPIALYSGRMRFREEVMPRARAWSRGRIAIGLAVAVVLTSLTFLNMDLAVKLQLAALRAESNAQILALVPPRIPDVDNAALIYQQAFEALPNLAKLPSPYKKKWEETWLDPAKELDTKDKDLTEFLHQHEGGLALLRKAAAMPACAFERDWFDLADLASPEVQRMRLYCSLLRLDARVNAERGEGPAALADVAAMYGLARHANEPILIAMLASAAMNRMAAETLEQVLADTRINPQDLNQLRIPDVSYRVSLRRALEMDEVGFGLPFMLSGMIPVINGKPLGIRLGPFPFVISTSLYRVYFLSDDLSAYRRAMKQYRKLASRSYAQAKDEWERFDQSVLSDQGGLMTGFLLPASSQISRLAAMSDATHRLAQLALAAESFRLKNGHLPDKPQDLIPDFILAIPLDPFDDQPLRFKRDGKDVVLYSIGPDEKDDGGARYDERERKGDIVFRLKGK